MAALVFDQGFSIGIDLLTSICTHDEAPLTVSMNHFLDFSRTYVL